MQRMSFQDASFLDIEGDTSPMHVGGVSIFEGPPPPLADVLAIVEGKLPLVLRYRQAVHFVPFRCTARCGSMIRIFDLDYHVRARRSLAPGAMRELAGSSAG